MKKSIFTFLLTLIISLNVNAQSNYSSIDDVKRVNYDLFQEIGFDESKMTIVSRLIYSTTKKSAHVAKKGAFPSQEILDKEFYEMFLKLLSTEDLENFKKIKHKIK